MVALCGSGGKTSMLLAFAQQLADDGVETIFTCTTRTEALEGFPVLDLQNLEKTEPGAVPAQFFLHNGITDEGKWNGLTPGQVDLLVNKFPNRVILVEVDGSANLPLKYYRSGEPVWPGRTSLAVLVMSMGAVGEAAGSVVHRFDREKFEPLKDLKPDSVWLWDHSYTLLTASGGYLDQVPPDIPVVVALTCMAEQDDSIGLFEFSGRVMENDRLPLIVFCETTGETPSFRTSCRRDSDDDDGMGLEE